MIATDFTDAYHQAGVAYAAGAAAATSSRSSVGDKGRFPMT